MSLIQREASGLAYLELVTGLLQRIRLASPEGGVWEAADLEWDRSVERLAVARCARMKITFMDDNPVSGHVYLSSGFTARTFTRTYRRSSSLTESPD